MEARLRYIEKELLEFDELLDAKIHKAQGELDIFLSQIKDLEENEDTKLKGLNDVIGSQESERLQSMATRQNKLIKHLENDKLRTKNKVFGVCREAGNLFSKERLKAVPHATLSISAKQAKFK